jgi:hypothetical protein
MVLVINWDFNVIVLRFELFSNSYPIDFFKNSKFGFGLKFNSDFTFWWRFNLSCKNENCLIN